MDYFGYRRLGRVFGLILGGLVLAAIGGMKGCEHAGLLLFGKEAVGAAGEARPQLDRRGRPTGRLLVGYTFKAQDGKRGKGVEVVADGWERPEEGHVAVLYRTGDLSKSRFKQNVGLGSFLLVPAGLLLMGIGGYWFLKKGDEYLGG